MDANSSLTGGNVPTAAALNASSLLDWIRSTDSQNKLSHYIDETKEMLHSFGLNLKWHELSSKIGKILNSIDSNPQMKEIEGLTKRLQDLNGFLERSKSLLASQDEICEVI